MFTEKKKELFSVPNKKTSNVSSSSFVNKGMEQSNVTLSGNFAKKFISTGNPFVDQFGVIGSYKQPRSFNDIAKDCETVWNFDRKYAILFIFYIRMITRIVQLFSGVSTKASQKGAEMRHEGIMRMIWLAKKDPKVFWANIGLFVSIGSWKDIITMLQYDLVYNGWEGRQLDWEKMGDLLVTGLNNANTVNLIKKYLPQIKARSKCTTVESQADTMIGKWICSKLSITYKQYRLLKNTGTAHEWQKLISQKKFNEIDFSKIHGRALNKLVKSKFLTNQNLKTKYEAWITAPETTNVKFTGFVHEVMELCNKYRSAVNMPIHEQETVNKQFETLVKKGGESKQTNFIVVRDTSSSMGATCTGTSSSCYDIAKSIALYFSAFLKGNFADAWIEFNSNAKMHKWQGTTAVSKWFGDSSSYVGSTNFQSVIELLCRVKASGVDESEFPTGILCISDGEFNPTRLDRTNVEQARLTLRQAGFSTEYANNFVIVLWNLQSRSYGPTTGKKFETYGDVQNVFYFSGYSAAVISFLTDEIKTPYALFQNAMDQEILQMIEV